MLDCSLRDGGYYTNWDFRTDLVDTYLHSFNSLPVEYLEIGYRSVPASGYRGEYFYLPRYVLERVRSASRKKIAILIDQKNLSPADFRLLLEPCVGFVDMVRIAVSPEAVSAAAGLVEMARDLGFFVCLNVMYMSRWKEDSSFFESLTSLNNSLDAFYMVDSYGGVFPDDVRRKVNLLREHLAVPIGFHGHNNLELALINTITAIDCGVEFVDATVAGMGRGAGNLRTELLLTVLNSRDGLELDFNALSTVVDSFTQLQEIHRWGTNLPYMVSGVQSLPQNDVMAWVSKRFYSLNTITRALTNKGAGKEDNLRLPPLQIPVSQQSRPALIVGGGSSVVDHATPIRHFLERHPEVVVIHASAKNAGIFQGTANAHYFCLVGNEGYRLESAFEDFAGFRGTCVLPSYPRKMGTYLPAALSPGACELGETIQALEPRDSHTSIALQIALALDSSAVYLVGYDGYSASPMQTKDQELFLENETLFASFTRLSGKSLVALTETSYKNLTPESIFTRL